MDRDLARALRGERKRMFPIHTNETPSICEGVLLWEQDHPGEDHNCRMLQDERYGGYPKSTLSDCARSVREYGDSSPYVQAAYDAGYYLSAPHPIRMLKVSPIYSAERWEIFNSEDYQRQHAVLRTDEDTDAAGVEHYR